MRVLLSSACILIGALTSAQQAILPAGHDVAGTSGTLSYSIGQIDFRFVADGTGSMAQGVQQPYEWLLLAVDAAAGGAIQAALLPNPAMEQATIALTGAFASPLRYELRDTQGRLLRQGSIATSSITLPLSGLPPAAYHVCVLEADRPLSTFQLIKN